MAPTSKQLRVGVLIAAVFFTVCLALSTLLPLWLDEVLQVIETNSPSLQQMLETLPRNAGAAPLGYVVQHGFFAVIGYSPFAARLVSAIFGACAVFLLYWLAVELGQRAPAMGAGLFALFPIVVRYSTESRVYSQALLLSVLASFLFWKLRNHVSVGRVAVYALVVTAAVYTHPYAGSVGAAHLAWAGFGRRKDLAGVATVGLVIAGAAFLPWYLYARGGWAQTVETGSLNVAISARTPLMILRELTGGGYWVSGASLVLGAMALRGGRVEGEARRFLVLLFVVPLTAVLAADVVFDYFVAARQFLWTLPALVLLAAAGIDRAPWWKPLLAGVAVVASIIGTVKYFTAPHENWNVAAQVFVDARIPADACVVIVPETLLPVYRFFEPRLEREPCDDRRVVVAMSPYGSPEQEQRTLDELRSQGYTSVSETSGGGSRFVVLERESSRESSNEGSEE